MNCKNKVSNIYKKKPAKVLLISLAVSSSILHAAPSLVISPIITSGTASLYAEKKPNLWFLFDDSGSMGVKTEEDTVNLWKVPKHAAPLFNRGFIKYDPITQYDLPKRINGSDMPLPQDWKTVYYKPFVDEVANITYETRNVGTPRQGGVKNYITGSGWWWFGNNNPSEGINACGDSNVVSTTAEMENCQIWQNYYSSRFRVLKSALSLALFDAPGDKNIRIGYRPTDAPRSGVYPDVITPVVPLYDYALDAAGNAIPVGSSVVPVDSNSGEQKLMDFKKWTYTLQRQLTHSGTTMPRTAYLEAYSEVKAGTRSGNNSGKNPFLKYPGRIHDAVKNPVKSCRRNYFLLLTDGAWAYPARYWGDQFRRVRLGTHNNFRSGNTPSGSGLWKALNRTFNFPDGVQYTPRAPYKYKTGPNLAKVRFFDPNPSAIQQRTVADIAFGGWATDLDGDSSNNFIAPKNTLVNGSIQTLYGSPYWHPYNDPASWQKINTITIGLGLNPAPIPGSISDPLPTPFIPSYSPTGYSRNVNAPSSYGAPGFDPRYLDPSFSWPIDLVEARTPYNGGINVNSIQLESVTADLANAAVASRGQYYEVEEGNALIKAFKEFFNNISKSGSKSGSQGSAGSIDTSQSGGSSYYSTRYDANAYTGKLLKNHIFNGDNSPSSLNACFRTPAEKTNARFGQLCSIPAWDASTLLTSNTNRKIITLRRKNGNNVFNGLSSYVAPADLRYEQTDFDVSEINPAMKAHLITGFTDVLMINFPDDNTRIQKLYSYLKGDETYETSGQFRRRIYTDTTGTAVRNEMGLIMRSSPVTSGMPTVSALNPYDSHQSFTDFINRYIYPANALATSTNCNAPFDCVRKGYTEIVYVGANDGMLHAFRADTGDEVFAYVPNAVYENLGALVDADKQPSLVDGNMRIKTIDKTGATYPSSSATWQQILVGSLGGGGKGVYALNVTDVQNTSDIAKWEYSDYESKVYQAQLDSSYSSGNQSDKIAITSRQKSNVGNIMSKPGIMQLTDGTWAVIVGNGYNSENGKAVLLVIDADTGKTIQELELAGDSNLANGLGPAAFVAFSGKPLAQGNRVDKAYAGDLQGNLWAFDFTGASRYGGVTAEKLFVAEYDNGTTIVKQPITVKPLLKAHPSKYSYLIHFGTGSLLAEDDISSNIKNSVYAIWDDQIPTANGGLIAPRTVHIERDHLRKVEFMNVAGQSAQINGQSNTLRVLKPTAQGVNEPIKWAFSGNDFTATKRGWYADLLVGERAWQSPVTANAANGRTSINYNTVRYIDGIEEDNCSKGTSDVTNWSLAFNPDDGSQYLSDFGTLDLNGDSTTSQGDMVEIQVMINGQMVTQLVPASGVSTQSQIIYSSTPQSIGENHSATAGSSYCSYIVDISDNNQGDADQSRVCRTSGISSWVELK